MTKRALARGSLWNQWDLHVHTPASFQWSGQKFEGSELTNENRQLVDKMIDAMNTASPVVFAIMDYWTFDGWFLLQKRLKEEGVPALKKTVFPGIELRLAAPTACRLNAHVIFSDKTTDQQLQDFLNKLTLETTKRALSKDALIELARSSAADILRIKGHDKNK